MSDITSYTWPDIKAALERNFKPENSTTFLALELEQIQQESNETVEN